LNTKSIPGYKAKEASLIFVSLARQQLTLQDHGYGG